LARRQSLTQAKSVPRETTTTQPPRSKIHGIDQAVLAVLLVLAKAFFVAAEFSVAPSDRPRRKSCCVKGSRARSRWCMRSTTSIPIRPAVSVGADRLAGERILDVLTAAPGNGAAIGGVKVVAEHGWFAARPSGRRTSTRSTPRAS